MQPEKFKKLLDQVKIALIHKHPFYGTILTSMNIIPADLKEITGIKVRGATDCYKNIYIDIDLNKTPEEIFAVLLHELHHVICLHSLRMKDRNPILWNKATDYAVNLMIKEAGYDLPPNSLICENFRGLTAEEIYNILQKESSSQNSSTVTIILLPEAGKEGSNQGSNQSGDVSKNHKKEKNPLHKDSSGKYSNEKPFDILLPPEDAPDIVEEKIKEVIIKAYMVHQKYGRGTLPGGIKEVIDEILDPKIPFEILLPRYATRILSGKAEYSFSPIKKRYALEYDIALPTVSREEVPFIIVVIDTSGSISTEDLKIFAGGLKKISTLTPEVMLITHDVEVQQIIQTSNIENFLNNLEFKGRGGTSHIPVINWIMEYSKKHEKPDLVIFFTDGYSEFPKEKPPFPVAWVINNDQITPPWGKVLRLHCRI